jgi:hypothetical protein
VVKSENATEAETADREMTTPGSHIALRRGHVRGGDGYFIIERGDPVPAGNAVSSLWMAPAEDAADALAASDEEE